MICQSSRKAGSTVGFGVDVVVVEVVGSTVVGSAQTAIAAFTQCVEPSEPQGFMQFWNRERLLDWKRYQGEMNL